MAGLSGWRVLAGLAGPLTERLHHGLYDGVGGLQQALAALGVLGVPQVHLGLGAVVGGARAGPSLRRGGDGLDSLRGAERNAMSDSRRRPAPSP